MPGIGPAIRVGMMGVIDLQVGSQTGFKRVGRIESAPFEKPPGQDAAPQLDLVEP